MGNKFLTEVRKSEQSLKNQYINIRVRGNDTAVLEQIIQDWSDDMIELAIDKDGRLIQLLNERDVKNIPEFPLDVTDTIAEIRNEESDKFEGIVKQMVDIL